MDYQILWFALWGILWGLYFSLDGFDFGVGMLLPVLGKNDGERRTLINTIAPVWDGNEVWLVTAGGVTFAAFPAAYAALFSFLYTPLLLILLALIVRGVAFEFRGKSPASGWRKLWDRAAFWGSLLPPLLFGVAFGNLFLGLPIDRNGYQGTFLGLLSPYALGVGVLFVLLCLHHGALWIAWKTAGDLSRRALRLSGKLWAVSLLVLALFIVASAFQTSLLGNFGRHPLLILLPLLLVAAWIGARRAALRENVSGAFLFSLAAIFLLIQTGIAGLFPNLIPSSLDGAFSLSAFNASSSPYTLKIMAAVALLCVPVVVGYQIWVYRIFRRKLTVEEVLRDRDAY